MKLPNDLVALPPGVDVRSLFHNPSELSDGHMRAQAFVRLNEFVADQEARSDSEANAVARLASALGQEHTTIPTDDADVECWAIIARRKAREHANAALQAGYQP